MSLPSSCEINGVRFEPLPGVKYPHNYLKLAQKIKQDPKSELSWYRELCKKDVFFILHFVLAVPGSNHPFVVDGCWEVMRRRQLNHLYLWAREHYKSSTITTANTIRQILANPEERIAIFSFTKSAATKFVGSIKDALQRNELLLACFPDVLWQETETIGAKWSEESLTVKRKSHAKEPTLSAYGLNEGMPTGAHFTKMKFDDIETLDLVRTPEQMEKCKDAFDMALYLGSDVKDESDTPCEIDVIGTFYHHLGPLKYIQGKKKENGEPMFFCSLRPGTVNGEPNGESVLLSDERMEMFKTNSRQFFTQILMNPTPVGSGELDSSMLVKIPHGEIPLHRLYKFMLVDSAGSEKRKKGDAWCLMLVGVDPFRDDMGASKVYILDLILRKMDHAEAMDEIVGMYMRGGRILQLAVEKVGISSTEIHICNALRSKGKFISVETGNLKILRPEGRKKEERIESNLQWPLRNGHLLVSNSIAPEYLERYYKEFDQFPYWHDDGLDTTSYVYDILRDYMFPPYPPESELRDAYADDPLDEDDELGCSWMIQ